MRHLRLYSNCSAGHQSHQQHSCYALHTRPETEHQRLLLHKLGFAIVERETRLLEHHAGIPY
jgi:hypothetical protein